MFMNSLIILGSSDMSRSMVEHLKKLQLLLKFVEQLILARAKGTYLNLLKRLAACDLLILDDFGIKPLEPQQYQDLYDVIDERGEEKSLILTSQTPPESWNDVISDPVS